jgi:ribonuclease-3
MTTNASQETARVNALAHLQANLGHTFGDQSLLESALTHPSYVNEHLDESIRDNERLEFLGDAVLDYLTAEYLFRHCPERSEGQLTSLRVALVRTETLASLARGFDLGAHLRLGRGEEAGGGRHKPTNLCAAFEALIGAVVLDAGIDRARGLVFPLVEPLVDQLLRAEDLKDAKTRLQELCQAESRLTPAYETIAESGPDHAKEFVVLVSLGSQVLGKGRGPSKQSAQQAAARAALARHFPDDSAHRRSAETARSDCAVAHSSGVPKDKNSCT